MSDAVSNAKQTLQAAQEELQRLERGKQALLKRFQSAQAKLQALMEHTDQELKRLAAAPPGEATQRLVAMNHCRRQAAEANLEMVNLLQAQNMAMQMSPNFLGQLEQLHTRSQFHTLEFQVLNYQPILAQLVAALGPPKAAEGEAPAGAKPSGPPRPGTAPLRPGALPAAGPPKPPAAPPRPLGAPVAARPAALMRQPAPLPRPGPPAEGKPTTGALARPGTGRLGGTGNLGGTGPLRAPGTGNLGGPANLGQELAKFTQNPEQRAKVEDLVAKLRDLDASLMPLRGFTPGELGVAPNEAMPVIRQVAGKVYYINRALASLGSLGVLIPFEGVKPDPALNEMWAAVGIEGGAEDEAAKAPGSGASLAGKLRSLFG